MVGFVPIRGFPARFLFGLAAVALILSGCGGGSTYSYDEGSLAQRFLPTERSVAYHPDSLGALTVTENEGTYQFELDDDYSSLHRKWSCTYQTLGAGGNQRGRSYATFWSLELSLASLQPELGITSLSQEQARESLRERRRQYYSTIQVDVYWFEVEGETRLAGPGGQVKLRVGGERYQPTESDYGPLREAFLPDRGRSALYRRNTFYFPRVVDNTDILEQAEEVELLVQKRGTGSRVRFAWSWEGKTKTAVGSAHQGGNFLFGARDRSRPGSIQEGLVRQGTVPTHDD